MNLLHLFLRKNLVLTSPQTPYLHFSSLEPFHFFYKLFNSIVFCRISNSTRSRIGLMSSGNNKDLGMLSDVRTPLLVWRRS